MSMDWKKTLATVAPAIATALGGPLAGVAVNVAAQALGVQGDEDSIASAVASGNPDVLVKLKEANNSFILELRRLDISIDELHQKDRSSAREMYEATKDKLVPVLAVVVIGGFMGMVWGVLTGKAQVDSVLAGTLIGYVSAKAEQVISFYFGSSRGSKEKTGVLAQALGNNSHWIDPDTGKPWK